MKRVLQFNLVSGGPVALIKNIGAVLSDENVVFDIASVDGLEYDSDIFFFKQCGSNIYNGTPSNDKLINQFIKYRFAKEITAKNHYDCIHIHSDCAYECLLYGLAARKNKINRIVFHSHSVGMVRNRFLKRLLHRLSARFLKYIGTDFLACSVGAAKYMYPNIASDRIVILKNGVNLELFRNDGVIGEEYRSKFGFKGNDLIIGHVGRFTDEKNHNYIIDVFSELHKKDERYKLLLLGDGDLRNLMETKVSAFGLTDCVVFTGNVSNVQDYMQAMDLFIFPSRFEGLGIVGIEAQACGLPCVFSTGVPEEAKLTENVEFVPLEDKDKWVATIEKMIKLPKSDNTEKIREAGYDINETAKQLESIYLSR